MEFKNVGEYKLHQGKVLLNHKMVGYFSWKYKLYDVHKYSLEKVWHRRKNLASS